MSNVKDDQEPEIRDYAVTIPLGGTRYFGLSVRVWDTSRNLDPVRDCLADEVERHQYTHLSDVEFYRPTEPEQLVEYLRNADDTVVEKYARSPEAKALHLAEEAYGAALRRVAEWWLERIES